ncbi:MAG: acid--CoA ligase [Robiginitomaculum sp.]|nr:MAG: acid--CoA ligase [Robiginitomaculum sp.]
MGLDLFDLTRKRAHLTPEKIAFEDLISGETRTYSDIEDRASRFAAWLQDMDVQPLDKVSILCRGRIEFFEILFACAKLGAILVPLNWRMPAAELTPIISNCNPKILVYGKEDAKTAIEIFSGLGPLLALDNIAFEQELMTFSPLKTREVWPSDDIWYLLYTSGTTGTPKAVIQTYQMALVNAINVGQAINITSDDCTLNFLPLFHTAGINLHTLPTFMNGGKIKLLDGFDADKVIDLLSVGEIDTFFAVPAVYQALAEHPEFADINLDKTRSFGCGGAPMPDILIRKFADKGALVCNGMGMTETGPTLFLMDEAHVQSKIGSVGKPQILSCVRIVDTYGKIVKKGDEGELEISGSGITPGYYQNPQETAKAFSKDGWLKSGDIARQDEDGFYYIVGRSKDMFISGGENVFPIEIENLLATHPSVLEAAIIGKVDEKWGEVGHAFIMLRQGYTLDTDALTLFCSENLARFKVPKSFSTVSEFPRTAAGKTRKHLLTLPSEL